VKGSILIVLALLFAVSASGLAQQSNVAEAVYNKWRRGASANEVSRLRFALASVTRRISDEVAEVELWAVGRDSQAVFEILPRYDECYEKRQLCGFLQELRQEQNGEITKIVVGRPSSGSEAGWTVGLKITVLVKPNTNALEIKWFVDANSARQLKTYATVFLGTKDKPHESLMWGTDCGFFAGRRIGRRKISSRGIAQSGE
jgi:hypothetical protein